LEAFVGQHVTPPFLGGVPVPGGGQPDGREGEQAGDQQRRCGPMVDGGGHEDQSRRSARQGRADGPGAHRFLSPLGGWAVKEKRPGGGMGACMVQHHDRMRSGAIRT
jgi:hypothetical protein